MIKNVTLKKKIQKDWDGVRKFQSMIQAHLNASGGIIGGGATHQLRNISHNLMLLFAFSVLETALKQLRDEGAFAGNSNSLKRLMYSSKNNLTWIDFKLIDEARDKRNKVAHQQKTLSRADCWKYIDAIEKELVSWNIVVDPYMFSH